MIKLKKLTLRDAQRYATLANDRKISGPFASVDPDDFPYPFSHADAVSFIKFARSSMQLKRASSLEYSKTVYSLELLD